MRDGDRERELLERAGLAASVCDDEARTMVGVGTTATAESENMPAPQEFQPAARPFRATPLAARRNEPRLD